MYDNKHHFNRDRIVYSHDWLLIYGVDLIVLNPTFLIKKLKFFAGVGEDGIKCVCGRGWWGGGGMWVFVERKPKFTQFTDQ